MPLVNPAFKVLSLMIVLHRIVADCAVWVLNLQNISKRRRSLVFQIQGTVIREMPVESWGYGNREIFFFLKILQFLDLLNDIMGFQRLGR